MNRSPAIAVALIRTLRPHQWVKNFACFAGVIFSGQLAQAGMVARAALAFVGFSLVSSAVYLLNDYFDRHRDRLNPRTANRPLAAGKLPLPVAWVTLAILLITAGAIAVFLGRNATVIIAVYFVSNVLYSLRLKRTVIADVMSIAIGFVLRVLFGVYAVEVLPSPWIILCMFFLALFLGFGKRRGELGERGSESADGRPVLRKYTLGYLDLVMAVTATITIMTYTLFSLSPHHDPTMVATVVPVVYCVLRYAHQVIVEGRGQSPETLFLRDRMMWIGVLSWATLCVAVLYGGLSLIAFPKP